MVNYLGFDLGLPKVYEQFGMLARVEEPVRRRFHSDVIELENPSEAWGLENKNWKPWKTGLGNDVLMPEDFNPITDERGYIYIKDSKTFYHICLGFYLEVKSKTNIAVELISI